MKARLMYRDRDFVLDASPPPFADELVRDLGLNALVEAMGDGDEFLARVACTALLTSLPDPAEITYRQAILTDCLHDPELAPDIYSLAGEALDGERKIWRSLWSDSAEAALHRSVEVLEIFVPVLRRLRELAQGHRGSVRSEGLVAVLDMLIGELSDEYFDVVKEHLHQLTFRRGVQMSARLGSGCQGTGYVLRRAVDERSWWARLLSLSDPNALTFSIPARDDAGWQAVRALRDEGVVLVAKALTESTDHILAFFVMLRREIGFYVGCLNLREKLAAKGEPLCLPQPLAPGTDTLRCRGLYEPGLSLRQATRVVGNDVAAEQIPLILITGANQGGKSTFLRSLGLAQLMMQCGMFVPADSFTATTYRGLFTHYRREEDASMTSGKLDEELARMNAIADAISPGCLLLSNESFASTNEREGSHIARHVVSGLVNAGVTVVAVTHLYDLAITLYEEGGRALFLRAERRDDGARTFRLVEGKPLSTSFGQDLYAQVFAGARAP